MSSRLLRRYRTNARRGYTAVEVLMAMTVMAIGAASVISMQKASMQGNLEARKTDVANSIARMWVERIQRDAMMWTTPGPVNPTAASNLATAKVLNAAAAGVNTWILPSQYDQNTPPLSPGFDILGRDLADTDLPSALFCVGVRMVWLDPNQLARVDVRVLWPRGISTNPGNVCTAAAKQDPGPDPLAYHSVYLTTAVRANPQ
jgi:prepilin-type N-terminal cleavage/methylation domain-containing protein